MIIFSSSTNPMIIFSSSTNPFVDFYDETDTPVGCWDGNQLTIYTSGTFDASNLVEVVDVFRSLGLGV